MRRVLLTGATGYIGHRLQEKLFVRADLAIRLFVRNKSKVRPSVVEEVEIVEGDTFDGKALENALAGIDTAFYLIHSMGAGPRFEDLDRKSALAFREACISAGVRRIVYLGGLGDKKNASPHLLSRIETGEILSAKPEAIQTIWFRAGVILGAGSASFEIIRNLVQKLPAMVVPRWVSTRTQPIAVDDVVSYLTAAIDLKSCGSLVVDIGSDPMNFMEMMMGAARVMGLRRIMIPVPVLSPKLSSYWLILFTPVPLRIASALVEGLKSETVVLNDNAERYFPDIKPMTFDQGVRHAMGELEKDEVISRWCDSSGGSVCDVKNQDNTEGAILRDRREAAIGDISPVCLWEVITGIGGQSGWFSHGYLWKLRGLIDKILGGYGLNRGRREHRRLRVGDALDFWKVADIRENKRLLLLAQMKLPGKAWLEFDIRPGKLVQTAHFLPKGLWGRLYWYSVYPLHHLVFGGLIEKIVEEARGKTGT